jgi:hypothetical protein
MASAKRIAQPVLMIFLTIGGSSSAEYASIDLRRRIRPCTFRELEHEGPYRHRSDAK